jgi:hypothetical protein
VQLLQHYRWLLSSCCALAAWLEAATVMANRRKSRGSMLADSAACTRVCLKLQQAKRRLQRTR